MEAWREELYQNELYHYGVKGMKWGVRRYQNPDGSYTAAGRQHYGMSPETKERVKRGAKIAGGVAAGVGAAAAGIAGTNHYLKKNPAAADAILDRSIKRGKDKENVSPAESVSLEIGKGLGTASEAARGIRKIQEKNAGGYDLSKKSNDQLKKEIERMQLEVRWSDLNAQQVSRGRAQVDDYLDVAQKIAMTGASIATVGALIYKIKTGR